MIKKESNYYYKLALRKVFDAKGGIKAYKKTFEYIKRKYIDTISIRRDIIPNLDEILKHIKKEEFKLINLDIIGIDGYMNENNRLIIKIISNVETFHISQNALLEIID